MLMTQRACSADCDDNDDDADIVSGLGNYGDRVCRVCELVGRELTDKTE